MIGLPDSVRACLFELDGVLTRTATVHAAAWKEMLDGYLRERAARTGKQFVPFDPLADYNKYVDGKPRYDGVRSFLAARGIELAEGEPGDPPEAAGRPLHGIAVRTAGGALEVRSPLALTRWQDGEPAEEYVATGDRGRLGDDGLLELSR